MDYTVCQRDEATVFRLIGRLTFSDHESFRGLLAAVGGAAGPAMVFDLSGLDFVDSSGLGMFIVARDVAHRKGAPLALRGARDGVKRVLTVARFHKLFDVAD